MNAPLRPAVFLDRDGTLIADAEYLSRPEGVVLLQGVAEGLNQLRQAGFVCVVVTNQSGIGRGLFTEAEYFKVHEEMLRQLAAFDAELDGSYFCPLAPTIQDRNALEHPDRKPGPGMLLRAARELGLDMPRSWMIGDAERDLLAGRNAGCRGVIGLQTGRERFREVCDWPVVQTFTDAVQMILQAVR